MTILVIFADFMLVCAGQIEPAYDSYHKFAHTLGAVNLNAQTIYTL